MPKLDLNTRHEVVTYLKENNAIKEDRREVWQRIHHGVYVHDNPWLFA